MNWMVSPSCFSSSNMSFEVVLSRFSILSYTDSRNYRVIEIFVSFIFGSKPCDKFLLIIDNVGHINYFVVIVLLQAAKI